MNYSKLQSLLPNHEIHYLDDTENEYQSPDHTFILFEYTTDHWPTTIKLLIDNHIPHSIQIDTNDLQFILI
jgi:hypothetical protein